MFLDALLLCLSEFLEVRMLECLPCGEAGIRVVVQQARQKAKTIFATVRQQAGQPWQEETRAEASSGGRFKRLAAHPAATVAPLPLFSGNFIVMCWLFFRILANTCGAGVPTMS